jgi:type II restriction enzyme
MATLEEAKERLDLVMKKARVHWYKPIQIAEILHQHRLNSNFDLRQLELYRTHSKWWRDEVTRKLVGRVSTSSARFQDNLFEQNAMPPEYLALLGQANEKSDTPGVVEAYIYASLGMRLGLVTELARYLATATTESFSLKKFLELFSQSPGLTRSIDKAYEIVVYALFDTLVHHLEATVTLSIGQSKKDLLREFEDFTEKVMGLTAESPEITKPASLYRVGVTNAADRGLDMWANFGPAVQVKHVSLNEELAADIVDEVSENAMVVIVCETAEQQVIEKVLTQAGFSHRVQGIVTFADLDRWYSKCFEPRFASTLGQTLLENLRKEFALEFPSTGTALVDFQRARGYDKINLSGLWRNKDM